MVPKEKKSADIAISPAVRAALGKSRIPVYLIVGDGYWRCRTVVDFAVGMSLLDGRHKQSPKKIPARKVTNHLLGLLADEMTSAGLEAVELKAPLHRVQIR